MSINVYVYLAGAGRSDFISIGFNPICSMYGIFTYIYHNFKPNVGKYTLYMDPMVIKS